MENLIENGGAVAVVILLLAVSSGLIEALEKYEETNPPEWLRKTAKVLREILKHLTSNTGDKNV